VSFGGGGLPAVWYADLAALDEADPDDGLRAVGWLERGRPFPTGAVDPAVYARLVELLKNPWEPSITMGFHECDLCLYHGEPGKRNLYLPAGRVVLVAPELIAHYMNAHGYRPPDEFCAALLACPTMRSVPYLKALMAGARSFMLAVTRPTPNKHAEPGAAADGGA
jgi:hypothetical protein